LGRRFQSGTPQNPKLLITSTTGISQPLGDPAKMATYLAAGDMTKLRRRLESDVFAFYRYGVLHGCVRLRWGFLDESLPVDWALPGDPQLYELLTAYAASHQPVELVWGSAPGWTDPRSRARRVTVVSFHPWMLVVEAEAQRWQIPQDEIQAVRLPGERADDGNAVVRHAIVKVLAIQRMDTGVSAGR
jgi:hypothetical protein